MAQSQSVWSRFKRALGFEADSVPPDPGRPRVHRKPYVKPPDFEPEFVNLESVDPGVRPVRLTGCRNWHYKLQDLDVAQVAGSTADVFVMDPHSDGTRTMFTPADVIRMRQRKGLGPQKLLAYMSIGEAEENRFYWNPAWIQKKGRRIGFAPGAPKWLDSQNGEGWLDNFKVRYWDPDWQALIIGPNMFLDRIVAAGFDGVYLDIVDGFEFFETRDKRTTARQEMVTFVERISQAARRQRADFLIVPQNGEELLRSAAYRAAISAIGKEDIFYDQKKGLDINTRCVVEKRPDKLVRDVAEDLNRALAELIPVLSVEYLRDDPRNVAEIPEAESTVRRHRFIPYFADRKLRALHPVSIPPAVPVS